MENNKYTTEAQFLTQKLKCGEFKIVKNMARVKSDVWDDFGVIVDAEKQHVDGFVACKLCKRVFTYQSKRTGTSSLKKHIERCMNATVGTPVKRCPNLIDAGGCVTGSPGGEPASKRKMCDVPPGTTDISALYRSEVIGPQCTAADSSHGDETDVTETDANESNYSYRLLPPTNTNYRDPNYRYRLLKMEVVECWQTPHLNIIIKEEVEEEEEDECAFMVKVGGEAHQGNVHVLKEEEDEYDDDEEPCAVVVKQEEEEEAIGGFSFLDGNSNQWPASVRRSYTSEPSEHQQKSQHALLYCPDCGKSFVSLGMLTSHSRIHKRRLNALGAAEEQSHDCPDCSSALTSKEQPSDGPQAERSYHCSQCCRRFLRLQHLKDHEMTHTGEKPYSCPACGKGFAWQVSLRRHKRAHCTGGRGIIEVQVE
ncbi:hypothetical protein UPYG_G00054910 [Umbra pygmaea]|uniref:Uncharacterized protein n=1 Tax=Umbra pygmaea TaxID=75934 RepID=A0ABD0X816_UMBPY